MTAEDGSASVAANAPDHENTGTAGKKEMQGAASERVSEEKPIAVSGASRHTVMTDAESGKQYKLVRCESTAWSVRRWWMYGLPLRICCGTIIP